MDDPGQRAKRPPAAAFKIAKATLLAEQGIRLGVESIVKIYYDKRNEFFGDHDLAEVFRSQGVMLRRMAGRPTPREEPFVPKGDSDISPHQGPRIKLQRSDPLGS